MKASITSLLSLLCAVGAPALAACTVDAQDPSAGDGDDVSVDDATAAKVKPGSFKLYDKPHAEPNPGCDVHTRLELKAERFSTASLEEAVAGMCELAVVPNARTYRLRQTGLDCGSRIFAGSVRKDGKLYSIKITDHRARLCENVIPAAVVVEETVPGFPGAITRTHYSYDGEMLVCPPPGTINCMPGPNRRLSNLCAADNRAWVQASCPGVSFTF